MEVEILHHKYVYINKSLPVQTVDETTQQAVFSLNMTQLIQEVGHGNLPLSYFYNNNLQIVNAKK
jgi:hypothetical protein